jgi:indole-3-glycerol phosphate synthase
MQPSFLEKIMAHKQDEVRRSRQLLPERDLFAAIGATGSRRSLVQAVRPSGPFSVNIIAEIKRASPSKGLFRADLDAGSLAAEYEAAGAVALSVLTDRIFFKGSAEDLKAARAATGLPVLRKDFIISAYQIVEAAAWGADAVLLIARILDRVQLGHYLKVCSEFRLDALVEVHSQGEIDEIRDSGAVLIGINNRNLATFETDIRQTLALAPLLSPGQIPVAASGINSPDDIRRNLDAGINSFLIGESLVRSPDVKGDMASLLEAGTKCIPR